MKKRRTSIEGAVQEHRGAVREGNRLVEERPHAFFGSSVADRASCFEYICLICDIAVVAGITQSGACMGLFLA
eukprot:939924-Pleurochrysis_carterae.AAC.1